MQSEDIDVAPIPQASPELLREIVEDGIVLYGSPEKLEAYRRQTASETTHEDRLAEFDELLADLERTV